MIIQQKSEAKMNIDYQGYNQRLNRIYYNPYSHNFNNNSRINSQQQLTSSSMQQYGLLNPDKNNSNLKSMQQLELRPPRQKRPAKLSASQIFTSISKQQPYEQKQEKPTINYFVTQFERLQKQNNQLLKQLQNYKSVSMKKVNNLIQEPTFQQKIQIISENKQLRQQLEFQRNLNIEKNQQIQKLVNKICQVQEEVQKVIKVGEKDREKLREKEREVQRERERVGQKEKYLDKQRQNFEMIAQRDHMNLQLQTQRQREEFQKRHKQLQAHFHERLNSQTQKLHQYYAQQRRSLLANVEQTQKQSLRIKLQQINRFHEKQLQKYKQKQQQYTKNIQGLLKEKQDSSKQYNEKIEGVKLYYNDIISQKFSSLMERIGELELQIQEFKTKYQGLEQEVQNIRYVPSFK